VGIDEDALIAQYVEENPRFPGAARAWLIKSGVPVWALVGYFQRALGGDTGHPDPAHIAQVAADYELPADAIQAALAYYRRHRRPIDERIADSVA
jgi:uncharacterized protein (DUF433 family)